MSLSLADAAFVGSLTPVVAVESLGAWLSTGFDPNNYPIGAGKNRILIVAISWKRSTTGITVFGCEYGSQPMTKIVEEDTPTTQFTDGLAFFYLLDAEIQLAIGATITPLFEGVFPDQATIHGGAYQNVSQINPIGQILSVSQDGSGPNPVFLPTNLNKVVGGLIIAGATTGEESTFDWTNGGATDDMTQVSYFFISGQKSTSVAENLTTNTGIAVITPLYSLMNRAVNISFAVNQAL